jgi:hypothetical protein
LRISDSANVSPGRTVTSAAQTAGLVRNEEFPDGRRCCEVSYGSDHRVCAQSRQLSHAGRSAIRRREFVWMVGWAVAGPGRLRLATTPNATGSPPALKTMGMVVVASFAASATTIAAVLACNTAPQPIDSVAPDGTTPSYPSFGCANGYPVALATDLGPLLIYAPYVDLTLGTIPPYGLNWGVFWAEMPPSKDLQDD